jgi:SAM-dependent methyltransferase
MMDDIARYNRERWNDLARNRILYSRPYLDLTPETAREVVDRWRMLALAAGEIAGKDVLALAGSGGQQSVAFAMLGARVTVLDLSDVQLERDRAALAHHGLSARLEQGDMRDLSRFADDSFDIVWQAHSITFIPDTSPVLDEVARVIRPGGVYRLHWNNPFTIGSDESTWDGSGYRIGQRPYADGEVTGTDSRWKFLDEEGTAHEVEGPREFNHQLSTVVNGLIGRGFTILGMHEEAPEDRGAAPGTWDHFVLHVPPWLELWARYLP